MLPEIEVKKIPQTDAGVDNSAYEFKVPYEHVDDYGNKGVFFRKETVPAIEYEKKLADDKLAHEKVLVDIALRKSKIEVVKDDLDEIVKP